MPGCIPLSVGWHGKLPSRGDFVGRGIPRPWLRSWDDWLQRGLTLAAGRWGTSLRDHLLAMPPWQAIVPPLQPGLPAWCVVVVASTDRVGRVFPLMVGESHEAEVLGTMPVVAWHARALELAAWLAEAAPRGAPKDVEIGAARLAALPWPDVGDARNGRIAGLRARWPDAGSFWWRVDDATDALAPLVQPWPPRETLLLDWLGEDDTTPPPADG